MVTINIYSLKQVKEKAGRYDLASKKVSSPRDAYTVIQTVLKLDEEACEKFGIITLNTKNEVAGLHILSVGTLNSTIVHPREVFKNAILNNAAALICFHNHPSGDPTPSAEDTEITRRLVDAGNMLGIEVLDHIIIGDNSFCSMREEGRM